MSKDTAQIINPDLYDAIVGKLGFISLLVDASVKLDLKKTIEIQRCGIIWQIGNAQFELPNLANTRRPDTVSVLMVHAGDVVDGAMLRLTHVPNLMTP